MAKRAEDRDPLSVMRKRYESAVSAFGDKYDACIEDIRFTREHAQDVGRIAILSDRDSVVWTALLSRLFVQAEIQVFDSEDGAREWLVPAT